MSLIHFFISCETAKVDGKFEAKLVVQALRINTLSKLTFSDCARFNALMKDVFPGIEFKDIEYEELAEAIRSVCEEANLRVNEIQVWSRERSEKFKKGQAKGQRNSRKGQDASH